MGRTATAVAMMLLVAACTGTADTTTATVVPTTPAAAAPSTPTVAPPPLSPCPALATAETGAQAHDVVLASFALPAGQQSWAVELGDLALPTGTPFVAAPSAVIVAAAGRVWALDAATCAVAWDTAAGAVQALHLADAGTLVVVDRFGVAVVDVATGAERWRRPVPWEAGRPAAAAELAGELLVVSAPAGELVAFDAASGDELWRVALATGGDPLSAPLAADGNVFVTHGRTVERRSLADGTPVWTGDAGFHVLPGLVLDEGRLFVVSSEDASVAALDAGSGSELWRRTVDERDKFHAPAVVDHGELHLLDWGGRLHHLDQAKGSSVFTGDHASDHTAWLPEHGLVTEQHGDGVEAHTLLERRAWHIVTGAGGSHRLSRVDLGDGYAAALTYSTE